MAELKYNQIQPHTLASAELLNNNFSFYDQVIGNTLVNISSDDPNFVKLHIYIRENPEVI